VLRLQSCTSTSGSRRLKGRFSEDTLLSMNTTCLSYCLVWENEDVSYFIQNRMRLSIIKIILGPGKIFAE
jgi:hypothetical protein